MMKGHFLDLLQDKRVVTQQTKNIISPGGYIRVSSGHKTQPGLPDALENAMDNISETSISELEKMGGFWFSQYGEPVIQLIKNKYKDSSLDHINPDSG